MNRTRETRTFVPMATFIGSIFIGDMFGQIVPQLYGPVFGLVFGFGFWLSMKLSNSLSDTLPIAVLVLVNVFVIGILQCSKEFAAIDDHRGISIRDLLFTISLLFSPLATVAIVTAIRRWRSHRVKQKSERTPIRTKPTH